MLTKVTHLTLFVHDQDEALNFYKKLGFIVNTDENYGGMRWLTLNLPDQQDFELTLFKAENEAQKFIVGKQSPGVPFISLESSDCHKTFQDLKAQNIKVLEEPTSKPWGVSMVIEDLYGNVLYICQSASR